MKPTKKCRVFLSRNSDDCEVGTQIRRLLKPKSGNLEFFDDGDIEGGAGWRDRLREELNRANLLLLLLTKPSIDEFDWPLYEAGLFESFDEEDQRRVVCITPGTVPSQLSDLQAVKATESDVLSKFLKPLFHDKKFTHTEDPLNENIEEDELKPLAKEIADLINQVVPPPTIKTTRHANYYLQLLLPPEVNALDADVEIESNDRSLQHLFNLSESPRNRCWKWGQLTAGLEEFNQRWTAELVDAVAAIKAGRFFRQISSVYLAPDGRLYRPGIEMYRRYVDGKMTIDVSFPEQLQDSWLQGAQPPVALAADLELASRIRFEVIEPYLRKINFWAKRKDRKIKGCAELSEMVAKIEHYERVVVQLTGSRFEEAFTSMGPGSDRLGKMAEELDQVTDSHTKIKERLQEALDRRSVPKLRLALQAWKKNNARFLEICLQRLQMTLA